MTALLVIAMIAAAGLGPQTAPEDGADGAGPPAAAPSQRLSCSDFQRLASGAWTPRRTVRVRGAVLTPGTTFTPGVAFGGVDLGAALEAHCKERPGHEPVRDPGAAP